MRNPWLRYSALRLMMFFGVFIVLLALSFDWLFAAVIAALTSFALSLLLLDRERDSLSASIHNKLTRGDVDAESDFENRLLDQASAAEVGRQSALDAGKNQPKRHQQRKS